MKKNVQFFEWGHIEWIYEPNPENPLSSMSIGITTILPNKRQSKHIHYGNEQLIYVISGEGTQLIGKKLTKIKPKQIYHMEAGTVHETINNMDKPIKHLLISIPANYDKYIPVKNNPCDLSEENIFFDGKMIVDDEIKNIFDKIAMPLKMPVTIFDAEGNAIVRTGEYPEICMQRCIKGEREKSCPLYEARGEYSAPHFTNASAYVCPHGMTVFSNPIALGGKNIGIIKGGHIRTYLEYPDSKEEIVPKGTLNAIVLQFKNLSEGIQNYYALKNEKIKLNRKEIAFEETIKLAKEKVLNIQISNHFLFNTLNAIAGMAVKEGAYGTYESVLDMSRMLRYTSDNKGSFVKLKDEIQYVKTYINLQKLRYGEKLNITIDISPEILTSDIPFNCLQPIVENCFVHGFKNMKDGMSINISGMQMGSKIILEIRDNGSGIDNSTLEEIDNKFKNIEKYKMSGMLMAYSKLKLFFGDGFEFLIESSESSGMAVKIIYNSHQTIMGDEYEKSCDY